MTLIELYNFIKRYLDGILNELDNIEYCLIITGPDDQRENNGGLMRRIVPITHINMILSKDTYAQLMFHLLMITAKG